MLITNEQAFEKLFRKHYSQLCNYAGKFIINSQAREDIVQMFFISIWEKKHLSITEESFLPYAYRSIKNSCINYYKAQILKEEFLVVLSQEWEKQFESENEFIFQKEVQQAVKKLPERCRKVFLLRCISGLKYKEIAEIYDISTNTVKYHLAEAFRIMRNELKDLQWLLILFFH